jgi:hypothetical protein
MTIYTLILLALAIVSFLLRTRPAFHDAGPPRVPGESRWRRLWRYPWRDRSTVWHVLLPGLGALGAVTVLGAPAWGAILGTAAFVLFWELNEGYVSGQDLVIGWASAALGTLVGLFLRGLGV